MARVLVVDDDFDTAQSLRLLVTLWGHEARTARDGSSALLEAASSRPAAVILDLGLPGGLNGFQVARRLRAMAGGPPLLIALTGHSREDDRTRAEQAGFDHFLLKPADPEELRALLGSLPGGAKATG